MSKTSALFILVFVAGMFGAWLLLGRATEPAEIVTLVSATILWVLGGHVIMGRRVAIDGRREADRLIAEGDALISGVVKAAESGALRDPAKVEEVNAECDALIARIDVVLVQLRREYDSTERSRPPCPE